MTILTSGLTRGLTALLIGMAAGVSQAAEDAGHGSDYRTFHTDGTIGYGQIGDSYTADLVMYLAGNQFMVMEELIKDFQGKHPDIATVYVETIPPGQILQGQLLKQGQIEGKDTAMNPDLYASVNLNHLKKLRTLDKMDSYKIYVRNRLELMVAAGNPKGIKGAEDLGRDDLVQSHPNPLTEGIFKFYGSEMLKDLGLYEKVTGGAQCKGCWAVPGKTWFTQRHHRETLTASSRVRRMSVSSGPPRSPTRRPRGARSMVCRSPRRTTSRTRSPTRLARTNRAATRTTRCVSSTTSRPPTHRTSMPSMVSCAPPPKNCS